MENEDFILKIYEMTLTLKGDLSRVEDEFIEYKKIADSKISDLRTSLHLITKRLEEAEKTPLQKSQRIIWLVVETFIVGILGFLGSMLLSGNKK